MRCPYCRSRKSKVLYTQNVFGTSKYRRRVCLNCKKSHPTLETIIEEKDALDNFDSKNEKINFPKDTQPRLFNNQKNKKP